MQTKSILERFKEDDIISSNGSSLSFSNKFKDRLDDLTELVNDESGELDGTGRLPVDLPDQVERLAETDDEFLSLYLMVSEFTSSLDHNKLIHHTIICDNLINESTPTDGVPEYFTPVRGERVSTVTDLYRRVVLYIWREDCDPCVKMREDFDFAFDGPPKDVALFAVFGPECSEMLNKNYSVVGGPTVLFMLDGKVDTRIMAPYGPEMIDREVEKLIERS